MMNKAMELQAKILSIGAWGNSFRDWNGLKKRFQEVPFEDDGAKGPKPEVIPANERRRAPLPVRLAVESSWQAVQQSPFAAKELSCVFVSALGDTQLTDYMCKVLAGESKQLSPTKFHNSVHNAAAGYWTISTDCMKAASSVAGYEESVPLTLLEAMTQIANEKTPVLLTFYDAPVSHVLKSLLKNEFPFAVSMVLAPHDISAEGVNISVEMMLTKQQSPILSDIKWPELKSQSDDINALYASTPTARILALLELLVNNQENSLESTTQQHIELPVSPGSAMRLTVEG